MIVQLANEEKALEAGSSYAMGLATTAQDTVRFSFVPFIIVLILLLVAVEWEVYRRGIATR